MKPITRYDPNITTYLAVCVTSDGVNLLGMYATLDEARDRAGLGANNAATTHIVFMCNPVCRFDISIREVFYDHDERQKFEKDDALQSETA
jgi:hypothetical protein